MLELIALPLLAVLLVLSAPPASGAEPPGCELKVTVQPARLTREERRAVVRVVTGGARPRLVASAGEFRNLRADGALAFVAEYISGGPEGTSFAVLGATLDNGTCGVASLQIGEAAEAGNRASSATPAGSGGAGKAGQQAQRSASLGTGSLPSRRRGAPLAAAVTPASVRADLDEDVLAFAFALDDRGAPRQGAAPAFSTPFGVVSRAEAVGPGVWRARWKVPANPAGTTNVTVRFEGEAPVTAGLARAAGPVAVLAIELDRELARSGEESPVTISIRARDSVGNATDAEVSADTNVGHVGEVVRLERGLYRASLTLPSTLPVDRTALVLARAGAVSTSASLRLAPGATAAVGVEVPDAVRADGATKSLVVVTVLDAFGNAAEETPAAEVGQGDLGAPAMVGPGRWVLEYRPRRLELDGEDVVSVRAGGSTQKRTLRLVAPTMTFSAAPKAGIVVGAGGARPTVGAEATLWTHFERQRLGLVLEGNWWSAGSSSRLPSPSVDFSSDRSYLPITLSAAWRRPVGSRGQLWATLGGGAARVSSSATLKFPSPQTVSEAKWALALGGAVRFGLRAWSGLPFAELRLVRIGDPHLGTLSGSITPIFLQIGYCLDAD